VIGIIWVNHHGILALVARVDRPLLYLNLLVLLAVAGIPFPTALIAEHLQGSGTDSRVAAAVYGGWATLVALSFNVMWRWIVHDTRLIHEHLDLGALRANTRRFSLGLLIYPITIGIAFVSPIWALVVHGLVAVYYVVDQFARGGASLDIPPAPS
jgi:TMEM175 potassium channel family protein